MGRREKKRFHAVVEIDMDLKNGETLEQAKRRMVMEFNKTDIRYTCTHRCNEQRVVSITHD